MQALTENPKAFIILVFPRLVSPSLVPDEYFMLKDFHFYKVACLEETLRQAPATSRPLSTLLSSYAYKKKIHDSYPLSVYPNPLLSILSLKKAYSAPAPDSLSKPTPSTTTAFITLGPDEKLPTCDISYHETRKPFDMGVLFPTMLRIQIEVDGYPSQSFMAQLSYGTLDIAIAHIIHMKNYTTFETVEMVVAGVLNLMQQRAYLFYLEMAMSETVATLKLAEEGDCLLRKVKEEEASHHVITNNTPNFPFDVKEDELLGGLAQGDGHASRGGPFIGDSSLGERA
ncbi:hypothetical protein AAG906_039216 [Vitis piasezkii]